ncbi:prepilin-type N-terminal cleavage/methylation domain-containing protein [Coraliomargarita algicola]|uniref:Prepilin-type N-terminal cleavage/methylation domain-containing protein n=1 Tax=Coraliomargarita algicola TaxID=3092156 RepID=A0ABZ0RFH3_9BACT|nr:prepilin-type N-terminal cleavage/methylation domain-containing protein [Coraliomargarita sp. J2-16]WPJ93939.1 prepilin-type N-terminal cleavage/methylation domain-containing protein [Coraliomargarita sp. J2-16]
MRNTSNRTSTQSLSKSGMTLAELLIAISISMILSAVVISFYLTFAKASLAMSDYSDFDAETGILLQNFSRDVREAESITWTNSNSFKLLKKGIHYTYTYDSSKQEVTRQETGKSSVTLASNVSDLDFIAYDISGSKLSSGISLTLLGENTKMLQIIGEFSKHTAAGTPTSAKVASARYILRNKDTPTP